MGYEKFRKTWTNMDKHFCRQTWKNVAYKKIGEDKCKRKSKVKTVFSIEIDLKSVLIL